jgi:hypothetical protein
MSKSKYSYVRELSNIMSAPKKCTIVLRCTEEFYQVQIYVHIWMTLDVQDDKL